MRPNVPAEEGFNQNISQTEDLPSSTLTTRQQELIREPTAETRHLKVAEEPHEEQDRTCEAKCPEDQAVEKTSSSMAHVQELNQKRQKEDGESASPREHVLANLNINHRVLLMPIFSGGWTLTLTS